MPPASIPAVAATPAPHDGDLIEADFRHLVEVHGHTEAYEPRGASLWRAHLFAHGLGPRNIPTVWDKPRQ
jgi:hypothetical protein